MIGFIIVMILIWENSRFIFKGGKDAVQLFIITFLLGACVGISGSFSFFNVHRIIGFLLLSLIQIVFVIMRGVGNIKIG